MKKKVKIIGSGTHSSVVIECALQLKYKIQCIVDINSNNPNKEKKMGIRIVGRKEINSLKTGELIFLAIGDNKIRTDFFKLLNKKNLKFINLVSPSSFVSNYSKLGKGVFVNNNSIINSRANLEDNCIINSGSIVEHDVQIGKNTHICSGVSIGGNTFIGKDSFIGIGSSILNNLKIGSRVTVGAGSVVTKNLSSNQKFAGSPAKKIK